MKNEKFPTQRTFNFQSRDATPVEIEQWQNEAPEYHETVKNVMGGVIAGSFFQIFTVISMMVAFYFIDAGLNNPLN